MSFTDDAVKAKLKGLNHTQESIVTVAQWVMFHRRYAERQAQVWLRCLSDAKLGERINLVYLANEVCQQSKARGKEDFVRAFGPILPEAVEVATKGADANTVSKIYRVVEVWRQRQIFDSPTLDAIESRLADVAAKQPDTGSAGSELRVPHNLQSLVNTQHSLSKANSSAKSLVKSVDQEFSLISTSAASSHDRPARLGALLKTIASAESAVADVLDKRREIIASLESLLQSNRAALSEDKNKESALSQQRDKVKHMQQQSNIVGNSHTIDPDEEEVDIARPEPERFTPPPVEALTPPEEPSLLPITTTAAPNVYGGAAAGQEFVRSTTPPGMPTYASFVDSLNSDQSTAQSAAIAEADIAISPISPSQEPSNGTKPPTTISGVGAVGKGGGGGIKRRRTSDDDFERMGFGPPGQGRDVMEGLDEDVVGMLG